ncbi:YHYH protein [Mucilaginibacter boryungensis]|uniref:YHYH protein n=1 Tax=Mucilaginibacter boryungensis TaxID=768480 RepID=A0ABR9XBV7_9SPHI|nr:YHYH protein [Mucilaginibacter boryungensis]MBE9664847.1 YHYH protein [Mucilaginibacter boryungensis]
MKIYKPMGIMMITVAVFIACKKDKQTTDSTATSTLTTPSIGANVPAVFKKIYNATDIYVEGDYVVIKTNSLPDHKSPYYQGTAWASTKYEAYNGTNPLWGQNPNKIAENDATFKIPLNPKVAATHTATPLGAMGVAVNGVAIFNQYAAMYSPLTNEANGFDQYGGHPQQQGVYHYHVEPYYITTNKGKDALVGFLLDGFPVYGPLENGKTITNADLDVYHGHTGVTADYPAGIYHYHITAADPYINGNGFYGTPGTVSQ